MTTDLIPAHVRYCRAAGLSERTIDARTNILYRLEADLPQGIECALPVELVDWLATPGWSASTRKTYVTHIAAFYRWATPEYLTWNPAADLPRPTLPPGLPHPISEHDLATALEHATGHMELAVRLGADAGLRVSEIATIDRANITPQRMRVLGKGGKLRNIPTHEVIWELVADMPAGPVVRGRRGPYGPHNLSERMSTWFGSIGLPGVTAHWLRHRFATQLLLPRELGGGSVDIRTVQVLMGHASVATTEIYLQVVDQQLELAIRSLPVHRTTTLQVAA